MQRCALAVLVVLSALCGHLLGATHARAQDPFDAYLRKDYATALEGFHTLAAQGNPSAMNNLGLMYANGLGVPRDATAAVNWYIQAAQLGHLHAINNLGTMYELGQGIPQDYAAAAEKYALAAKHGLADAQYNLGALYEAGKGVPNDWLQAYIWYSIATRQGDTDAAAARERVAQHLDPKLRQQADDYAKTWQAAK